MGLGGGPLGPILVLFISGLCMPFMDPWAQAFYYTGQHRTGRVNTCEKKKQKKKKFSLSMGLQWVILTCVVAAEASVAILLTIPSPKILKNNLVSLVSLILQPAFSVVPFAGFQLLDIYWKNEHRLMCTSEICTAAERDRYEKSIYKAQRNVILCASSCLLYWCIYRICKYYKEIQKLEEIEKKYKEQ